MGYLDSTYCLWPDEKLELANGIFLKKKYFFLNKKLQIQMIESLAFPSQFGRVAEEN